MVRLIVIAAAVFLGIYLLSRWSDKRQTGPNEDTVVRKGAGRVLILASFLAALLLLILILPRLGIGFGNFFQTVLNFLPLARTLLAF